MEQNSTCQRWHSNQRAKSNVGTIGIGTFRGKNQIPTIYLIPEATSEGLKALVKNNTTEENTGKSVPSLGDSLQMQDGAQSPPCLQHALLHAQYAAGVPRMLSCSGS